MTLQYEYDFKNNDLTKIKIKKIKKQKKYK